MTLATAQPDVSAVLPFAFQANGSPLSDVKDFTKRCHQQAHHHHRKNPAPATPADGGGQRVAEGTQGSDGHEDGRPAVCGNGGTHQKRNERAGETRPAGDGGGCSCLAGDLPTEVPSSRPERVKLSSRSVLASSARSWPYSATKTVKTEEMSAAAATRSAREIVRPRPWMTAEDAKVSALIMPSAIPSDNGSK